MIDSLHTTENNNTDMRICKLLCKMDYDMSLYQVQLKKYEFKLKIDLITDHQTIFSQNQPL